MKRVGKAALAVFAAAAVLLGIKNEYARLLPVSTYGMQAAIRQERIENLFIGSSMFRQGLDIGVLEEALPGNSYILTYNGNQPAFMAMELQYMLDQGLTAENLYIDLYPYTAAADPWISDTKILMDTDIAFKLNAWALMKEGGKAGFSDFYEFFVTANNEQLLTYPINNRLVSAQFRNGGNTMFPAGKSEEQLAASGLLGSRDGLSAAQVRGYEELCKLARENGMTITFLETPKYIRMYEDPDYCELYDACLKEMERLPEKQMILAAVLDFDSENPAYFQDLIHLSGEGRVKYTEELCAAINAERNSR